jgi:hypothetical protein
MRARHEKRKARASDVSGLATAQCDQVAKFGQSARFRWALELYDNGPMLNEV